MKKYKIACVIVTYNRKALLRTCLEAISLQTFKPERVFIVDNASSDGTIESVKEWGFKDTINNGIYFDYILMPTNQGGAGGFYEGIRKAHKTGLYDGVWVMDDDGIPNNDCLEKLVSYLYKYHFISPMVVDVEDVNQTSFMMCSVEELKRHSVHGIILNTANPFNGVLFSSELIDTIGYPKKEMFIWGDEMNYILRARHAGMNPIMVVDSIHRHPRDRQQFIELKKWGKIRITDSRWKMYCLVRNSFYNEYLYNSSKKGRLYGALLRIKMYASYALKYKHDFSLFIICLNAVIDGYMGNFNNLHKYFKI